MSRRIEVSADTLDAALRRAVADLLDCPEDKVDLRVDAPGIDGVTGRFRLDVAVAGPARDTDADDDADSEHGERGERGEAVVVTPEQLDEEADAAADFLEGLLDALELPGDLRIRVHEDHAEVEVVEIGSGALIGRRGQTLEAIQELVRCALQREFQRRSRVKIDAEGYRSRRLEKLLEKAEEAIEDVLDSGEPIRLEPMDVFERKAVHHLVTERGGVLSRSQGREPARRVIIELDE
ncbi:MAG: KH domain-containing protein [Actinobacteria bacterium]|jgi:spoIIIJ-associated protein|nr:KH domain-containing protein [Actinomycetota bacterium]